MLNPAIQLVDTAFLLYMLSDLAKLQYRVCWIMTNRVLSITTPISYNFAHDIAAVLSARGRTAWVEPYLSAEALPAVTAI